MEKRCQYYFAPNSPWTYFGHARFVDMARRHDVQVEVKPVDLGRVFGVSGGLALAKRPVQRQAYRLVELKRWSEYLQIPLNIHPKFFPVPTDAASKFIVATNLTHGTNAALQVTGAVIRAVWVEERNINDPDTLLAIGNSCGHDGKGLLETSETADVQREYDRHTDEAIAANVFGAPWYVVNGEAFWGQDRLDFVERALSK